jgi:methylmalonyl-CoA mutase
MSNKTTKLFEAFPPISNEDWKNKIVADLKGADFDKKLVWKTIEGFDVQPYYRQDDLADLSYLDVKPAQAPFVRGNKRTNNDWFVRQDIKVANVKTANAKALTVLMKGITSIGFVIEDANSYNISDVEALLNDIALDAIEACFVIKKGKTNFLKLFVEYVNKKGFDKTKIEGSINVDFLGNLTLKGAFCYDSEEKCTAFISEALEIAKDLPKFRVVEVHADYFHNSGSTLSQELAFGLAVGADYISKGVAQGLSVCKLANKIKFNFAVGSDYFMEIAKFRASKLLWAKIIEAYEPKCECCYECDDDCEGNKDDTGHICLCCQKMNIHAVTATWNKTIYDPYVNMLRTTTEAMAASIGGIDSMTILPFNIITGEPTDFSERIARNQQIVLKEESYLDKIVDPSAGSYYIEKLTDLIAENSWKLFLEVQEKGGYVEAFKKGYVQDVISKTQAEREKLIATRRDDLLGTNQFPNFSEVIKEELDMSLFEKQNQKSENAIAEPLNICRGAQAFELLRYKTDKYSAKNGRPLAFMLTIGNLNFRKARAQFACNFFACAGFDVIDNNGFDTIEQGLEAAKKAGAIIIVLCSSDEEYATLAPEAFDKIKNEIFVVAGAPACSDELKAKGITNFIHVKSNVLAELQKYQADLKI